MNIRNVAKKAVSWLVFAWASGCGVLSLSLLGYSPHASREAVFVPLLTFGLLPILASLFAIRSRKWSARLFLASTPLMLILVVSLSYLESACKFEPFIRTLYRLWDVSEGAVVVVGLVFLLPGVFWFVTDKLRWQPLLAARAWSVRRALAFGILGVCGILALTVVGSAAIELRDHFWGECNYFGPPLVQQKDPFQAVFTGRVIRVIGRSKGERDREWAVASVDQHFWGLPLSARKLVFLRPVLIEEGKPYLIEGHRPKGLLTRFLPILDIYCSRTKPLQSAGIDLRLLSDGSPRSSGRIIGLTETFIQNPCCSGRRIPNGTVVIAGPSGSAITRSDAAGIYDLPSLPPGHYELSVTDQKSPNPQCRFDLKLGDVEECILVVGK